MDKKEMLQTSALTVLIIFLYGSLLGIIFNLFGYTHISVTSWQYWLACSSLLIPMITSIALSRYNIPKTSILGRSILFYGGSVTAIIFMACVLDSALIRPTFLQVAIFMVSYPCLLYLREHPWTKSTVAAMKNKFIRT